MSTITVASGTTKTNPTIYSGDSMIVSSRGVALSPNVSSGGRLDVNYGGTATQIVENGGYVWFAEGAVVTFKPNVFANMTLSNTSASLHSGTTANNVTVKGSGYLKVFSGGVANNARVSAHESIYGLYVESGGTATKTHVEMGGYMVVSSGGTATEIVENGGYVRVEDGANVTFTPNVFTNMTLSSTSASLHSGTTANNVTMRGNGYLKVFSGGEANNINVSGSKGSMFVANGGSASGIVVHSGGILDVNYNFNSATMVNPTRVEDVTVSSGGSLVLTHSSGHFAALGYTLSSGAILNLWGAWTSVTVSNGVKALVNGGLESTIVSSGGTLFSIDSASSTWVKSGGTMRVRPYAIALDTIVSSGGTMLVSQATLVSNTVVSQGGEMVVSGSGGLDSFIYIISSTTLIGGSMSVYGIAHDVAKTIVSGTTKGNGLLVVSGYDTGTSDGGTVVLFTHVKNRGSMRVISAMASETTISSGGSVYCTGLECNKLMDWTDIYGGYLEVYGGGSVTYTTIYSKGSMLVSGRAQGTAPHASNVTISSGGRLTVSDGGWVSQTYLSAGGKMFVESGGHTSNTRVSAGGTMFVNSGGRASDVTVHSGASMLVSGGTAYGQGTIGGYLEISGCGPTLLDSGVVSGIFTLNGAMTVGRYGSAYGFTAMKNARVNVVGGTGTQIKLFNDARMTITDGGVVSTAGIFGNNTVTVSNGGTASAFSLYNNNASMVVSDGGEAKGTRLHDSSTLIVSEGGTATDTTIDGNATMIISSGGSVTGEFCVTPNVSACAGAVFDFSTITFRLGGSELEGIAPGNEPLITNLNWPKGNPEGNIAVSPDQREGTYILAEGYNIPDTFTVTMYYESEFDYDYHYFESMELFPEGRQTLSVGTTLFDHYKNYTLSVEKVGEDGLSHLCLEVFRYIPFVSAPVPSADTTPTQGNVTVTATFDPNGKARQYRFAGDEEWLEYNLAGVTVTENCMVEFRSTSPYDYSPSDVATYTVDNIDRAAPKAVTGLTATGGANKANLSWKASTDSGRPGGPAAGIMGYTVRFGTSLDLSGNVIGDAMAVDGTSAELLLEPGTYYCQVAAQDWAGNFSDWSAVKSVTVTAGAPKNLHGDANGLSWDEPLEGLGYRVTLSNASNGVLEFLCGVPEADFLSLPKGTYNWQVREIHDGAPSATGNVIKATTPYAGAQVLQSDYDMATDLFFAQASGVWESGYSARHDGFIGGWTGTKDRVELQGRNILADFFMGSYDYGILALTDDANGDALFLDDIYTALPGSLSEQQARVAKITEIRAGAGNDIIDLTSQKFAYVGDGITVYGGAGDDVIWANTEKGSAMQNWLYGDAGDDRIVGGAGFDVIVGGAGDDSMHGGGGSDTFVFGGDWGHDTIDQLSTGTVTLCFEKGSKSKWNAKTRTYTDGDNSVKVLGTATVSLKFGEEIPNFAVLQAYGAFLDCASERVFEDKSKGMLA